MNRLDHLHDFLRRLADGKLHSEQIVVLPDDAATLADALDELAQLRAELERFREVARDLLAWHDNGHVVLLQDHADKLRRLLDGEQP